MKNILKIFTVLYFYNNNKKYIFFLFKFLNKILFLKMIKEYL